MLSMHTSPLAQPGVGDAGGMNVYIMRTAEQLAANGVEVEVFTRATARQQPPSVSVGDGITVHHVPAGPFEGLAKNDLPSQLCAFTAGVLRAEASHPVGYFDVIHSHYWLSGQAGWLASDRWNVPLVHSAHTLAKVKNRDRAANDAPEPFARVVGEEQVVAESDALVANTDAEADELVGLYGADPAKVMVVPPGVDTTVFRPGDTLTARRDLGLADDAIVIGFVGRIQALKGPDVALRAVARLRQLNPRLAERITMIVVGGPSGPGTDYPHRLRRLVAEHRLGDQVRFLPPRRGDQLAQAFRACDVICVPSHNETFGLVALEAQACGIPVVAAAVGGLTTAVVDGTSGVLVNGHDETDWAHALDRILTDTARRDLLSRGAVDHAHRFTWRHTATDLIHTYREVMARHRGAAVSSAPTAGG